MDRLLNCESHLPHVVRGYLLFFIRAFSFSALFKNAGQFAARNYRKAIDGSGLALPTLLFALIDKRVRPEGIDLDITVNPKSPGKLIEGPKGPFDAAEYMADLPYDERSSCPASDDGVYSVQRRVAPS